mmetsp:Transcript_82865/g.146435  ORF Transcript_82865/g.146435 Transcript_82865/m.146435 type:complete len:85 (-) Transcript_82865:696-950(-)
MELIEDAKAPPPKPQHGATMQRSQKGQSFEDRVTPIKIMGKIASVEFMALWVFPPHTATRKEFGTRSVAPASPARDGSISTVAL